MKYGGGGGEGRKRLQTNLWILKTSVRQRTELVIGWASQKLLVLALWVPGRSEVDMFTKSSLFSPNEDFVMSFDNTVEIL